MWEDMHRSANHLIQGLKLSEDFSVKGGPGANSLRMLRDIGGGYGLSDY